MNNNTSRKIAVFLTMIICLSVIFAGCSRNSGKAAEQLKNVRTMIITPTSISVKAEYPGKLKPREEITIAAKSAGIVENINFDIGMPVKEGELLVNMDEKEAAAQLGQSKASLDNAKANLVRTSDSSLTQQLTQAETTRKQARVQYDDTKATYEKVKQLYDMGAASRQEMDAAELKMKNAEIQLESADSSLELLKSKGGQQLVDVASAQVEQAEAVVKTASILLDNTRLVSPINGVVSARYVDAGEIVTAGTQIMSVIDASSLMVETGVPERIVQRLAVGDAAEIRPESNEEKVVKGHIDMISPNIDSKTQSYAVRIKLDNPGAGIKPGVVVRVVFTLEQKADILAVPSEAITIEGSDSYVVAVRDGHAKRIKVITGISNEALTQVEGDIHSGDEIIIEGQGFIDDGEKVTIIK